jgi:hypothetical protein
LCMPRSPHARHSAMIGGKHERWIQCAFISRCVRSSACRPSPNPL